MADYNFYAFFVASKVGKTGLTPTVDVHNSAGTEVVTAGDATEIGDGLYLYTHTTVTADDYIAVFKTADTTVDAQHVPSLVAKQVPMIDVAVSTRLADADYVDPTGNGGSAWVYNLKDDSGNAIPDADIWVTSDLAGAVLIASGQTDASGNVTFYLAAGTYYIWGQKAGYNFTSYPDTEVIT